MSGFAPARLARFALAFAVTAALAAGSAFAQAGKPIRILVGFAAGGGTDAIARTLAEKLKDKLDTSVVAENRAGAGGRIAAQALEAAAPDGTTPLISRNHVISIMPLVLKDRGFDPVQDVVPVAGFATLVNALALSPGTPKPAIDRFSAALARMLAQRDVRDKLAGRGLTAQFMTSERLAVRERADSEAWA